MMTKQLKILVVRHEKCSSLGMLKPAIARNNIPIHYLNVAEDIKLSEPITHYSHIIILGGAASAYEDGQYPYLRHEFQLVEAAIAARIPIVGICLGSQILAQVLGAKVYRGALGREVGWCDISLLPAAEHDPLLKNFPQLFRVFQFHQDTFDTPSGCVPLAKSDLYPNQAFRYQDSVWAIQFHLDMDEQVIRDCSTSLAQGLKNSGIYDTTIEDMIAAGQAYSPAVQSLTNEFMTQFLQITCYGKQSK
jgi:GMP synthase (glutamine-hydrolysing)